jgi:hypothetical protein
VQNADLSLKIETALRSARDFESFAHGLLRDCLNWPVERNTRAPDEIGYSWSGDELRFEGMEQKLTAREVLLTHDQPYGIFLLEFKEPRIFDTRGFTTPLRKALRGLVASRRKDPNLRSWALDKILFICTHDYQQYVFAQFWDPFNSRKVSDARLATFGWKPGIPSRTAVTYNLPCLVWPDDAAGWNDWRKAFDKEPLTRSFFKQFDAALDLIKADLEKLDKLSSAEAYSKAQLLLERLIFLYFVQNRGWLEQQPNFFHANFAPHALKPHDCSYYAEFLEKLFWSLSIPPGPASLTHRFEGVPFLNGGLFDDDEFDPSPQGRRRNPSLSVRNSTFARVFDDLLEAFNFTVREDTPLNQEVAVDPEMLGKVFESIVLHAEAADPDAIAPDKRKATGSYYTPRIVVHFICREVLYQHLLPRMTGDNWSKRLRCLLELDASDSLDAEEKGVLRECLTPEQGSRLLDLVKPLRCCDPAVGSGAFMVGLLHELTNLRRLAQTAANGYVDPLRRQGSRWLQETKADIIENCLFGVDIQQQAIEICMLRLWLSLVVDYDIGLDPFQADKSQFQKALGDISQLPNLEMNFKRGDSLHDHVCGVPIVVMPGKLHGYEDQFKEIQKLGAKLHKAKSSDYKRKLRLQILDLRIGLSERILEDALKSLRRDDSTLANMFGESRSDAEKRKRIAHESEQLEKARKELVKSRRELDSLIAQPLDSQFMPRLRRLEGASFDSPLNFVWRIDFPQVFGFEGPEATLKGEFPFVNELKGQTSLLGNTAQSGGFDIIVGNPPFVTARNPVKREMWRERWQPYCQGTYNLLVPFFPLSFALLKSGGELGFIVSNAFMKREFGQPLIESFFPRISLREIVDCSGLMFPGHGTPTCLVFGGSSAPSSVALVRMATILPGGGDLRTPPEDSALWHTLEREHESPGYNDGHVSIADRSRKGLSKWPWTLDEASLATKESSERSGSHRLVELVGAIGYSLITKSDDIFFLPRHAVRIVKVERPLIRAVLMGDQLRNWSWFEGETAICPYDDRFRVVPLAKFPKAEAFLTPFKSKLSSVITFGKTKSQAGRKWYEYFCPYEARHALPVVIAFPDIVTHGHFVPVSGEVLFKDTAPIVVPRQAGDSSLAAAQLNSSVALFWFKQVCFSKRESEAAETDTYYELLTGKVEQLPVPERIAAALKGESNPLATRLAELAQVCWERGHVLPSLAMKKLFEESGEAYHKWNSSLPGHVKPHEIIGAPFESAEDLQQAYERVVAERERLRSEMIALQEEMDWLVYAAYGLLPENHPAVGGNQGQSTTGQSLVSLSRWTRTSARIASGRRPKATSTRPSLSFPLP